MFKNGLFVNQQGKCLAVDTTDDLQVYSGPLSGGDLVVALLNRGDKSSFIQVTWEDLKLPVDQQWTVEDVWEGKVVGQFKGEFGAQVDSHETLVYRFSKN